MRPRSTVQIVDPETFTSEWVLLENQTAADNNIPIIPFYDGDRWKWNDISFWVSKYPQFFKIPAIEYHRTYHKQSKALLVSKAKGQKRFSEQLVAPNEVVATAAQKLAVHMEDYAAAAHRAVAAYSCKRKRDQGGWRGVKSARTASQPGRSTDGGAANDAFSEGCRVMPAAAAAPAYTADAAVAADAAKGAAVAESVTVTAPPRTIAVEGARPARGRRP